MLPRSFTYKTFFLAYIKIVFLKTFFQLAAAPLAGKCLIQMDWSETGSA